MHIGPGVKALSKLAPVLPLYGIVGDACGCKKGAQCPSRGKHPASAIVKYDGSKSGADRWAASSDPQQIQDWEQAAYSKGIEINWAMVTGKPIPGRPGQYLICLDIDPRNGGDELLSHYEAQYGKVPLTWTVLTGGGGQHYYLAVELTSPPPCMALVGGIEIKGEGGYVVIPHSRHASGREYTWDLGALPSEVKIALAPGWVKDLLTGAATAPRRKRPAVVAGDPASTLVGHAFGAAGLAVGQTHAMGVRPVECPWSDEHTDGRGRGEDTSSALLPPMQEAKKFGGWRCQHAHCANRGVADLLTKLPKEAWAEADRLFPNQLNPHHREIIGLPPDAPEPPAQLAPPLPPPPPVVFFADAGLGDDPPPDPSPASPDEAPGAPPRRVIRLGSDIARICSEIRTELALAHECFLQADQIVVVSSTGSITKAKVGGLQAQISRVCDIERYDARSKSFQRVVPPKEVCATILEDVRGTELAQLRGVAQLPYVTPDGGLVDTPGFDPRSGYVLAAGPELERVKVPELSQLAAAKALAFLYDVTCDMPFVDETHRYGWVAYVLTLVGRAAIDGCTPLFVFDASAPGSGKSAIASVGSIISHGTEFISDSGVMANAEEMRKAISSSIAGGDPLMLLDNFTQVLRSPPLEAAITSREWSDRALSTNEMIKAKVQTVFCVTANNIKLGNDITRRSVVSRIVPTARPTAHRSFKHGEIKSYARRNRLALYAAALTILAAHGAANKPHEAEPRAGFEEWAATVASAIVWAGGKDVADLFADRGPETESADDDESNRELILENLTRMYPGDFAFTTRDLLERLWGPDNARNQWQELADAFDMLRPGINERGWSLKSLAYLLRDMRDRPVGAFVLRSKKSHGIAKWTVSRR